jgi:hypothetical protein
MIRWLLLRSQRHQVLDCDITLIVLASGYYDGTRAAVCMCANPEFC